MFCGSTFLSQPTFPRNVPQIHLLPRAKSFLKHRPWAVTTVSLSVEADPPPACLGHPQAASTSLPLTVGVLLIRLPAPEGLRHQAPRPRGEGRKLMLTSLLSVGHGAGHSHTASPL